MEGPLEKTGLILIIGLMTFRGLYAQNRTFEKAIDNGSFRCIERIIKKEIRKVKKGTEFFNGTGSGMQTSFVASFDSIVNWLLLHKGVIDATWDKCQAKAAIYPGSSTIGVVFKTKNGPVEKCYRVQEGTTARPNIMGWRPVLFKARMILKYRGSKDCSGFVENQKKLCDQ